MKRIVMTVILVLVSSVALALPTPRDIETAVKAGQLSQAEAMLHEVIKEKPGSAKAHYELGQVLAREGKNVEARDELLAARRLDPSLKFTSNPQRFRDLLERIPEGASASKAARLGNAAKPAQLPALADTSFPWGYVLLGAGVLMVIWFVARRAATSARPPLGERAASGSTVAPGGYGAPGYGTPTASPGSGIGGALVGGLAGLAAGYGLSRMLEGGNRQDQPPQPADDSGFIPIDSGNQPDYGAFDAGSGDSDSWDAADSSSFGGGDDDNW